LYFPDPFYLARMTSGMPSPTWLGPRPRSVKRPRATRTLLPALAVQAAAAYLAATSATPLAAGSAHGTLAPASAASPGAASENNLGLPGGPAPVACTKADVCEASEHLLVQRGALLSTIRPAAGALQTAASGEQHQSGPKVDGSFGSEGRSLPNETRTKHWHPMQTLLQIHRTLDDIDTNDGPWVIFGFLGIFGLTLFGLVAYCLWDSKKAPLDSDGYNRKVRNDFPAKKCPPIIPQPGKRQPFVAREDTGQSICSSNSGLNSSASPTAKGLPTGRLASGALPSSRLPFSSTSVAATTTTAKSGGFGGALPPPESPSRAGGPPLAPRGGRGQQMSSTGEPSLLQSLSCGASFAKNLPGSMKDVREGLSAAGSRLSMARAKADMACPGLPSASTLLSGFDCGVIKKPPKAPSPQSPNPKRDGCLSNSPASKDSFSRLLDGSPGLTFRNLATTESPAGSPQATSSRADGIQLCPSLVVPEGMELVFAIRDLVKSERQNESFAVVDLEGQPLSYVIMKENDAKCGILVEMLDKTPLAWIKTKPWHTEGLLPEICFPSGEAFCKVVKEGYSPDHSYLLKDPAGSTIITFHGDFLARGLNILSKAGRLIGDTEPLQFGQDGGQHYQVRVAPGIDACLVLCGLIAVFKVEGGPGSMVPGMFSSRTPGPLTARARALQLQEAAGRCGL